MAMKPHASEYSITDRLPGWSFRVTEVSAGAYRAEGVDAHGRRVSADGTDPNASLGKRVAMAEGICKALPESS